MCSQKLSALPCGNTFEKSCRRWLRDSFPFGHSDLKINCRIIPTMPFKNTWMTETRKALFSHQNEFFSDRTQGPSFSGFFLWPARFWTLVLVLVEVPPLAMVQAQARPLARLLESDFEKMSMCVPTYPTGGSSTFVQTCSSQRHWESSSSPPSPPPQAQSSCSAGEGSESDEQAVPAHALARNLRSRCRQERSAMRAGSRATCSAALRCSNVSTCRLGWDFTELLFLETFVLDEVEVSHETTRVVSSASAPHSSPWNQVSSPPKWFRSPLSPCSPFSSSCLLHLDSPSLDDPCSLSPRSPACAPGKCQSVNDTLGIFLPGQSWHKPSSSSSRATACCTWSGKTTYDCNNCSEQNITEDPLKDYFVQFRWPLSSPSLSARVSKLLPRPLLSFRRSVFQHLVAWQSVKVSKCQWKHLPRWFGALFMKKFKWAFSWFFGGQNSCLQESKET